MAGPRRHDRTPRSAVRHGRHHAPGRAALRSRRGFTGQSRLRGHYGCRAPSPSLRGQQPLPAAARDGRTEGGRMGEECLGGGSVRDDRVVRSSVVFRLPVSPGIHLESAARPPALRRLRQGCAGAPRGPGRRSACARATRRLTPMRLCGFEVGLAQPLFLIAGPCVVESRQLQIDVAGTLREMCAELAVPFIFKSSYDKANRSSSTSFRGLGMEEGLRILGEVKRQVGVPVLTDVHSEDEVADVASVVDVLQTPAFLCRQTDFIHAVAAAGKPVNIKKGQFLAPEDMANVVAKAREASGQDNILVCERGASFGYHNLVSDMRSLAIMRRTGCPVVFDATHSVQLPGGQGTTSGGQREFVPVLARAAVAVGVAGLFMETHPNPAVALSDGPNAWPLDKMEELLFSLKEIDVVVKNSSL